MINLKQKLKEWTGRELTGVEMQNCNRAKGNEYHVFGAYSGNYSDNIQEKIYSASGCGADKTFQIKTIDYERLVKNFNEIRTYDCNGRLIKREITKVIFPKPVLFSDNMITPTEVKRKTILYNLPGSFFGRKIKEKRE